MPALASETEAAKLLELVRQRSFRQGRFTLSSGVESNLYFNLKPTMMHPEGALLAARAFLEIIRQDGADYVGGLEMGAVPLIGALAAISAAEGAPVKTFFVRKQAKDHGTRDVVEGLGPNETLEGARVLIVDDVATTGGAILKTAAAVRAVGAMVESALVVVDRQEGGSEILAKEGIKLLSVFRASDFVGG